MGISDVLNISISVSGAGPTREGFGEPLIAGYHTHYNDRVREYSELSDLVNDGFAVTDPIYLCAAEVKAQNPCPPNFKVGRRALPFTQVLNLTCLSTSVLDTYVVKVRTPGGAWHTVSVASTGTPSTDATSIKNAISALSLAHVVATTSSATVVLTQTAGFLVDVQPGPVSLITFADVTTDPGIATDLAAILGADSAWYGLLLDNQSASEITGAAAWAESNGKLFIWNNSDSADMDSTSTSDIFATEKGLSHARSAGLFAQTQLLCYSAAAWMGRLFPTDPGSENWAYKTLSGVPVDNLTDGQQHNIRNKNGSVYVSLFGENITMFGQQPGGEWIDVTRGTDALQNDMQVGVLALQVNNLKIPFTDAGIDMYRNVLTASLQKFVDSGFLAKTPAPFVSVPLVANVDATDKANRNLPGVKFSATIAGAINQAPVSGTLTQ